MTRLEEAKQQIREAFERAKRERLAKEARNNCIKNGLNTNFVLLLMLR